MSNVEVYVLNRDGTPLMPCRPAKARKLLKAGKAKVVHRTPFTIRLLWDCEGHTQELIAGMDTGSKKIGVAVVNHQKRQAVYAAEVTLRDDISKRMTRRREYRNSRRSRKTRYRKWREHNRASARRKGRLAPSIRSKLESHLRERRFVESILPVTRWVVETTSFDIAKISNPGVQGKGYQEGPQQGFYNTKQYVLHRDGYRCQKCRGRSKDPRLTIHHILWRSRGGTDEPNNLVTLCRACHDRLHAGEWVWSSRRRLSKTKHAAHENVISSRLRKSSWSFQETFGYQTKYKREWNFQLPKSHVNDALAICCSMDQIACPPKVVLLKRHVPAGDYRQTKGKHSQVRLPTGKLFGLRKFDLIQTSKGVGFVKGKRRRGSFDLMDATR